MKLLPLFLLIFLSFQSRAQDKSTLTKIYFKVVADCKCQVQFTRNDKPAGKPLKMVTDSFKIAIDAQTTGFYIKCGSSKPAYVKIPYRPGQGFFKILGKMPCDKNSKGSISIEPMKI